MTLEDFRKYIDQQLRIRQRNLSGNQRDAVIKQFESTEFLNYDSLLRMPDGEVEEQIDSILSNMTRSGLFSESVSHSESIARRELRAAHCKFPPFCKRNYER